MEHVSFVLKIDPKDREEYRSRHEHVDPELEKKFAEVGIRRYHIYYLEDHGTLFAYMEVDNFEQAMHELASDPANLRWQAFMSDMLLAWENGETSKSIPEMYRFVKSE